jgi:exodeoxyribonuclease V alpha subunit
LLELSGTVNNIVFENENNQYKILEISSNDVMITATGIFPFVFIGDMMKIKGDWYEHPVFGRQFKAVSFERQEPQTVMAIKNFLISGGIKGIGPVTAVKIVDVFAEKTLDIMENDPMRLIQIKGITEEKAKSISEELKYVRGMRDLMIYLGNYNVKPEEIVRIWKLYGKESISKIEENPYLICEEDIGASFFSAESIAEAKNIEKISDMRLESGIFYVLRHNADNGHTCLPEEKLVERTSSFLGVDIENISSVMEKMINEKRVCIETFDERRFVFLPDLWDTENEIADRMMHMLYFPAEPILGIDEDVEEIEKEQNIEYADKQKEAVHAAMEKGIVILTGGPGTGKTTTLNAMIKILKNKGNTVYLAAPTGRAAKRMTELTGEEAKTIHRMLQVAWDELDRPVFMRNESNPLECDTLIIDELSMVDVKVFAAVLQAIPYGCRLILVGDSDQLPSVGPGNVLGDLISSAKFPTVELNEIFRQAQKSLIVTNAHKIIAGENIELDNKENDFFFMPFSDPQKLAETITELYTNRLPSAYGYDPVNEIQILCPGKKGIIGTESINVMIRNKMNPSSDEKQEVKIRDLIFRENDKVMQIKNDYELIWEKDDGSEGTGIFNGDIGIITKIDKNSASIYVRMDDRDVTYDYERAANELELAYAVTVHKSQGNEFDAVIIPILSIPNKLRYRNLLYTGITRAKKTLILMGSRDEVYKMIKNTQKTKRYTGLKHFLFEFS